MGYQKKTTYKWTNPDTGKEEEQKAVLHFNCQICKADTRSHELPDGSVLCHKCYVKLTEGKWKECEVKVTEREVGGNLVETEIPGWECVKCGIKIGLKGLPPKDHTCANKNATANGALKVISGEAHANAELGFAFGKEYERPPDNDPGVV